MEVFTIGGGKNLPKNRLVLEVVAHYAAERKFFSLPDLKNIFPDNIQGTFGVVASLDDANAENAKGYKRYFTDNAIHLEDGPVAVCNQWRADNLAAFIDCAQKLEYEITALD